MEINAPETANTSKILKLLRRYTTKPIQVKDVAETHPTYLGVGGERKNWIEVYLNTTVSTSV